MKNDIFYIVTFDNDSSSYFFHSKNKAKEFIWQSYLEDFSDVEDVDVDKRSLEKTDFIEDYAWIQEGVFED